MIPLMMKLFDIEKYSGQKTITQMQTKQTSQSRQIKNGK